MLTTTKTKPKAEPLPPLPEVIGIRTEEFAPLLIKWQGRNRGVPWSELLRRSLKASPDLRAVATKRDEAILN